jgi:uncharacterized protein (TIGR02217 family)
MSGLLYPTLSGVTPNVVRSYVWNTGKQKALSEKQSVIAFHAYPPIHFELEYELLDDALATSDLKALVGFHNAMSGSFDSFLFTDPEFNTITPGGAQTFATGNGSAGPFQLIAFYQNTGGPGTAELIQNLNGTPVLYDNGTPISAANYTISATGVVTFGVSHFPVTGHTLSWSGSFYYRCRFDDDEIPWTKFQYKRWTAKKVAFTSFPL